MQQDQNLHLPKTLTLAVTNLVLSFRFLEGKALRDDDVLQNLSVGTSATFLACACHSFHYIQRLFETIFVHRFSNGTMPLRAIIRNCAYYWGFAAWLAYYINHPLYTPPSETQVNYALIIFAVCNVSVLINIPHRCAKCRRFPHLSKNPFTWLFYFVSCPNYTYEVTFIYFMALFTLVGFVQMTIWAKGKHKTYTWEFKDYPNLHMSILPFIL
uniref:Trans-2,3-enoyl-CoA reductase-like 2a n=1 Tax=Sinocyclocheilus anshuiensis TaxID=1608454 RepID=A0A671PJ92_9TELE